jgi:hypothetical protein
VWDQRGRLYRKRRLLRQMQRRTQNQR